MAITLWMAIPLLLWIVPADYFDYGTSICPSQVLLHKECPGCGLTRAVQHAMHLDLVSAWHFNKLVVIIFPIMIMLYFHVIGKYFGKEWFPFLKVIYTSKRKEKNRP
jgi:Protein of unknown function (DUF2752)